VTGNPHRHPRPVPASPGRAYSRLDRTRWRRCAGGRRDSVPGHEDVEVYQIAYNIIYQAAARHFLIEAAKVNVGVVTMHTMTSGIFQREAHFLAPEWQSARDLYEVALKFVLSDSPRPRTLVRVR
jgi:hypothetical protein